VRCLSPLAAIALLTGGVVAISMAPASAAGSGAGTCMPYVDGNVVQVPCSAGSGSGGSNGGNGGAISSSCTTTTLGQAQATGLGLAWPPPAGESWALLNCFAGTSRAAPQAVLVSAATGLPQVTPQQLLEQALGELRIPYLDPSTAPPRGKDGLVGLPEWFWIPAAGWHGRSVTVHAGPVWASVTAQPDGLTLDPGAGLGPVSCAGPGTAYDPGAPAQAQHTACSYTYDQPSLGQPGNAYQASLTVTWRISWTGSGGQGGMLAPALPVTVSFPVRVAQGEALVSNP
jgi:hypothetical protein